MSTADRGFTLVEVLVALGVFALAALTLLRLLGVTIASTEQLGDRVIGGIVARNVAIEALIGTEGPPRGLIRGTEINAGQSWTWTRRIGPAPDPRLDAIAVTVADEAGRPAGALTLYRRAR